MWAFNFVKWENYGYLLWDYEACTWWMLYRDFKTRQNPPSLSCPTFLPSTTYQIWSLPWNLELELGFVLADMKSLKFLVKGGLFPHLPLSGCTRVSQSISDQFFGWEVGGERSPTSPLFCQSWNISLWLYGCDNVSCGERLLHLERKRCK